VADERLSPGFLALGPCFLAAWDTSLPLPLPWREGSSAVDVFSAYLMLLGSQQASDAMLRDLATCINEIQSFFGAKVFDHTRNRAAGGWALASGSAAASPLLIKVVLSSRAECARAALLGPLAFPCLLRNGAADTRVVTLQGHIARVSSLQFSTQADLLVSMDHQLGTRVWRYEHGECLLILSNETHVREMALSDGLLFSSFYHWSSGERSDSVCVYECDADSPDVGKVRCAAFQFSSLTRLLRRWPPSRMAPQSPSMPPPEC